MLDFANGLLCREGSDIFLQRLQRHHVFIGKKVAAHAERLTEFDKGLGQAARSVRQSRWGTL